EHVYHHTSPVLNVYALQEALRIVAEEGLDNRLARHCQHAAALRAGLDALGLCQFAHAAHRVASVVTVLAPDGISATEVRNTLLAASPCASVAPLSCAVPLTAPRLGPRARPGREDLGFATNLGQLTMGRQ